MRPPSARAPLRIAVLLLLCGVPVALAAQTTAGWDDLLAGRHDRAREAFITALALDPTDLDSAIGLAALLEARGDPGGAEQVLARALEADARGSRAAGALTRLGTLVSRTPDGGAQAIPTLEGIASGRIPTDGPEIRALAALALADARTNQGQPRRARDELVRLRGRVTRWTLLGPWGRLSRQGLRTEFPPERCRLDVAGLPPGPSGHRPRRVDVVLPGGRVTPPVPLGGIGVLFAVADLEVPRPVPVLLRVGSPVSFRAFLDGSEVLSADFVGERPPISRTAALTLPAGRHRLLIKLANDETAYSLTVDLGAEAFEAGLRVVEPQGCPRGALEARPADSPLDHSADGQLPDSPAEALARIWWLRARNLDRQSGRLLAALRERWPEAPLLLYLSGEHLKNAATGAAASEDLTGARTHLEQALEAAPDLVRAALLIGEIDLAAGRLDEAWGRAGVALAVDPDQPAALLLRHQVARRRGFLLQADRLLERARARAPGWTRLLVAHRELLGRIGAIRRLREVEDELARRAPSNPGRAVRALAAGRAGEAVALLRDMVADDPTNLSLRLGLVTALLEADRGDEALAALDEAERIFPGAAELAERRAAVLAGQGAGQERIDRELARALDADPGRLGLRRTLELRRNDRTMRSFLADIPQLVADARPAPAGVDSALLADVAVVLLDRFGGQTELYQGVHKVYTRDGVEKEGELQVQPGAQIERLVIHKSDGRTIDVELPDRPPFSLPGLEPGDVFAYVWRRYFPPFPALPGALDNRSVFLFQGPDREYLLSRYVILHAPELAPSICGNIDGLAIKERTEAGLVVHSFTARESPRKPVEPHVPDTTEIVPHVRLAMGTSWELLGEIVRGRIEGLVLPDPPLPELVSEARHRAGPAAGPRALARAIHEVVGRHLEPGAASLDLGRPASAAASAGEGNRALVALALSLQLGLDARLILTRPVEFAGRLLDCPMPGLFGYPLVEIADGEQLIYLDFNDADHPFDTIPVRFLGSDAQRIPLADRSPASVVRLPWRDPGTVEEVVVDATLSPDGTLAGSLTLTARDALASMLRRMLRSIPEDRRSLAYESLAARWFAGARTLDARVEGLDDPTVPLVVKVEFAGGALGRPRPTGLALPMVTSPLGILEEFGSLPARSQPLLFDLQEFRHDVVRIRLPAGIEVLRTPEPVAIDGPFGSYGLSARIEDGTIEIERRASMPPRRVETSDYARFRDFARLVADAERAELLLAVESPSLESSGSR